MKKIFFILILLLGCVSLPAQNSWEIKEKKSNNLYVDANFSHIADCEILNTTTCVNPVGATVGYARNLELGAKGLYMEVGAELSYQQGNSDFDIKGSDDKYIPQRLTLKILNGKLPVNLGYKFPIDEKMVLRLYAGANFQYFISTKENWHNFKTPSDTTTDFLNKKSHYGVQVGANIDFNDEWFGGAEFSQNLSQLDSGTHPYTLTLRIGYRF